MRPRIEHRILIGSKEKKGEKISFAPKAQKIRYDKTTTEIFPPTVRLPRTKQAVPGLHKGHVQPGSDVRIRQQARDALRELACRQSIYAFYAFYAWWFFPRSRGPLKRYAMASTRMSGHNCLPGPQTVCSPKGNHIDINEESGMKERVFIQ